MSSDSEGKIKPDMEDTVNILSPGCKAVSSLCGSCDRLWDGP